ncbi:MAG: TrmH family RNA methyltransferase [Tepidisphaerales bacterium]
MPHIEGRVCIEAALAARKRRFDVILVAHGTHTEKLHDLRSLAEQLGVPLKTVLREELDAMAHGRSHGGVIAVCSPRPRETWPTLLERLDGLPAGKSPLLLLLEGVDDARNLGFTLRTAEAFGVDAVLLKKHLWDFDEGDVSRSSSGAYERLPLVQFEDAERLSDLQARGIRVYGCLAGVRRSIYRTRLTGGVCLAVGGEKRGLSGAVRRRCDRFVTLPTVAGAPSLSLTAATAAVLSEAYRQRLLMAAASEETSPETST